MKRMQKAQVAQYQHHEYLFWEYDSLKQYINLKPQKPSLEMKMALEK